MLSSTIRYYMSSRCELGTLMPPGTEVKCPALLPFSPLRVLTPPSDHTAQKSPTLPGISALNLLLDSSLFIAAAEPHNSFSRICQKKKITPKQAFVNEVSVTKLLGRGRTWAVSTNSTLLQDPLPHPTPSDCSFDLLPPLLSKITLGVGAKTSLHSSNPKLVSPNPSRCSARKKGVIGLTGKVFFLLHLKLETNIYRNLSVSHRESLALQKHPLKTSFQVMVR